MQSNRRYLFCFMCCSVLCLVLVLISLSLGNFFINPLLLFSQSESLEKSILVYARLPRTIAALFAGAALAVAGSVLQEVLANRLASPGIIGINAGAGLGVTLCGAFGIISGWRVSAAAFVGAMVAVAMLTSFARGRGISKVTVILAGVALNSMLNAANEAVAALDSDIAALSAEYRVGGFAGVTYARLLPALLPIAVGLVAVYLLQNELDVLALGDVFAQSVGLPVRKYRLLFLLISALLSASAVSFCGLLGFVGLVVPHFVKRIVSHESRKYLPLCAVAGGGLVLLCDVLARTLFVPYEIPVGILMSVIGAPVFVAVLVQTEGVCHD